MDKEAVFVELKKIMILEFKLEEEEVRPEARLADELELDSLDMVDLILSLKDYIGDKIEPGLFKNARVMQDLVDLVYPFWKSE